MASSDLIGQGIRRALDQIQRSCAKIGRTIRIMEVCGTHTVAIFRHGIRQMLPGNLQLISGPGCPVCVTDDTYMDMAVELASRQDCLVATYGDMIRVPASDGTLEQYRASGSVRVITSADDALILAKKNQDKTVVFLAVGFETTAPATAVVLKEAAGSAIENLSILCGHKLVVPAMQALLESDSNRIDGFLCPGHVSVIIGSDAFRPVVSGYGKPCIVAGFEPIQILTGLARLSQQLADGRAELESVYDAAVRPSGNRIALDLMNECLEPVEVVWRGLGPIKESGLGLRSQYRLFDATHRFALAKNHTKQRTGCRCGDVLRGIVNPDGCPLFAKVCRPESPVGPCMVSSEGTCAAYYKYGLGLQRSH